MIFPYFWFWNFTTFPYTLPDFIVTLFSFKSHSKFPVLFTNFKWPEITSTIVLQCNPTPNSTNYFINLWRQGVSNFFGSAPSERLQAESSCFNHFESFLPHRKTHLSIKYYIISCSDLSFLINFFMCLNPRAILFLLFFIFFLKGFEICSM